MRFKMGFAGMALVLLMPLVTMGSVAEAQVEDVIDLTCQASIDWGPLIGGPITCGGSLQPEEPLKVCRTLNIPIGFL